MVKAKRQKEQPKADKAMYGVVGRFAAYFGVFVLAILLGFASGKLQMLLVGTAAVSAKIAAWIGIAATTSGTHILLPSRTLSVDLPCTALFIVALFSALVLSYPVSWQQRLLGLAVGIPIILATNIVRIVAAAEVSESIPSAFTFFHDYLFQMGMVLVTVAIWAAWLTRAQRHAR